MNIKDGISGLFKKKPFIRSLSGETIYEPTKEDLSKMIHSFINLGEGAATIENIRGEWIQFLYLNKGNFFLERRGSKEEIKKLKNLKIQDISKSYLYFYKKQLKKEKLLRICLELLNQTLEYPSSDWEIEIKGAYKTKSGFMFYIDDNGILLLRK